MIACFKVATKFRSLYFIILKEEFASHDLLILGCGLQFSSTTMESLPLKVPDFGLQRPTGPSSGAVAYILLVSSRLDCPGMSLAEVCATCLEESMWSV